jgi:hypothetical protein
MPVILSLSCLIPPRLVIERYYLDAHAIRLFKVRNLGSARRVFVDWGVFHRVFTLRKSVLKEAYFASIFANTDLPYAFLTKKTSLNAVTFNVQP